MAYIVSMKNIILKLFLFMILFSLSGFSLANADNVVVNNTISNAVMVTEYDCDISGSPCSVDKIKYIQTGAIFYDAECTAPHMMKSTYESRAISDVSDGYMQYCSMHSRTLKGAN